MGIFAVRPGCRVSHFSRRFCSKFFANADAKSNGLTHAGTGLYSHTEPDAHADSARSNKNYRQPDANSQTVTNSYTYPSKQSQSHGDPYTNSCTRANRLTEAGCLLKTKPASFELAGPVIVVMI